jgi:protein TonB
VWISVTKASNNKLHAMTNNEILRSSLLDIIFDNRNKDYGAYALRKTYNHRLVTAMMAAAAAILLFLLLTMMNNRKSAILPVSQTADDSVILTTIDLPRNDPHIQPARSQPQPRTEPVASIQDVSNIAIVPDDKQLNKVPSNDDLNDKITSDVTSDGRPPTGIPELPRTSGNGGTTAPTTTPPTNTFEPDERLAEYPGGDKAFHQFLSRNLVTPDDLEPGEKRTVMVRFKVDVDGTVSQYEITVSGGQEFDREVLRVCKKMGRWKPARQNGIPVAVSFQVPVTFIGLEQ